MCGRLAESTDSEGNSQLHKPPERAIEGVTI